MNRDRDEDDVDSGEWFYDDNGAWVNARATGVRPQWPPRSDVRDAAGNVLANGNGVILIEDFVVEATGLKLKRGTSLWGIRLTDDPKIIAARYDGGTLFHLETERVRKL